MPPSYQSTLLLVDSDLKSVVNGATARNFALPANRLDLISLPGTAAPYPLVPASRPTTIRANNAALFRTDVNWIPTDDFGGAAYTAITNSAGVFGFSNLKGSVVVNNTDKNGQTDVPMLSLLGLGSGPHTDRIVSTGATDKFATITRLDYVA